MKILAAATAIAAVGVLFTGCSGSTEEVSVSTGPTATVSAAAGSSLGPAEFAAAAKQPGTVILDVRTAAEFAEGHLPGAVLADVESADFAEVLADFDPELSYAVYCRSGNRSKVAMTAMEQLGFAKLYDLAGGISAWQSAGGEVVQ